MQALKSKIEIFLENIALFFYDNAYKTLLVALLFIGILAIGIPKLQIETTIEGLFKPGDTTLADYEIFRSQFGQDDLSIAAIQSDKIFTLSFLSRLRDFHLDLENTVPYLKEVTSLYNVSNISGDEGSLIVEDLMEDFPQTAQDLAALQKKVIENPLYKNLLISESSDFTLITILNERFFASPSSDIEDPFIDLADDLKIENSPDGEKPRPLTNLQKEEIVAAIRNVVAKHQHAEFDILLTGGPVVDVEHIASIHHDVGIMMGIAGLLVILLLFVIFRRASGVTLPLLVVSATLISMFGVMGFLGLPITPVSQMFPTLMLAVGVADAVHYLTLFYREQEKSSNRTAASKALGKSGLAMLFTSLTTAAGFLSFSQAQLLPIADIGIVIPLGVLLALISSYTLLPAMVSILKLKPRASKSGGLLAERALVRAGDYSYQNPKKIIALTLLLTLALSVGIFKLEFSHNVVTWLPADNPVRLATETVNKEMKTTVSLEIIIDTKKINGLYEPHVMQDLENINRIIENLNIAAVPVSKSYSIVDTLKQIHQALNENNPDYYLVPNDRQVIAQALLLFENGGSDDLEELVDSQFSKARVTIRVPWVDAILYIPLKERIEAEFNNIFSDYASVTVTGYMDLLTQSFMNVLQTMSSSYMTAFIIIGIIMLIIFGDIRLGFISLVPNFFPIFVALSFMGLFKIPIDMFTVLMGGIALGLAVDDTVHFIHHFQRHFLATKNVQQSIKNTLSSVGRAILFTTTILAGAFFIYTFASVGTLANLGFVLVIAIVTALITDVIVTPALLALFYKKSPTTEVKHHA